MARSLLTLPFWLLLITANAMPVYGAAIGKLVFFQVIFLYWFESLLLILFDCFRIGAAQGSLIEGSLFTKFSPAAIRGAGDVSGWGERLGLMLRTILVRSLMLAFYLLFIILFVAFQVTGEAHSREVALTLALRHPFFNTALAIFVIQMLVQLCGFFISGRYLVESPHNYASIINGRTVLMHVMIVGSVFIHSYFFEGKTYAATGEVVYVGLFMLIKTVAEIMHLRNLQLADAPVLPVS